MSASTDLLARVNEAIKSIRPYLEADGGDVQVLEVTAENKVIIELLGACGTCRMSSMTLKAGVEETIKRLVPEIVSVEAVNLTSINDPKGTMPS